MANQELRLERAATVLPFFFANTAAHPRAMALGLHISIDPRAVRTWEHRFEREIPDAFARANKFVLDEIAKTAVTKFRADAHTVIDRPKAWTLRGIRYKRATYSTGDWSNSYSEIYTLPDQSAVLKYLMGERTRRPGDVGPSTDYIAVPRWNALREIGVRPDKYGNMPSSAFATRGGGGLGT